MFIHTNLIYILGPAIIFWVVVSIVVRHRAVREADPVRRAWVEFKLSTIATGSVLILLWFALPSTPSLSTFGYPANVQAVSQPPLLLRFLQDQNRALVRTTQVVYWLLFVMVWWFISAVYSFSRSLTFSARQRGPSV